MFKLVHGIAVSVVVTVVLALAAPAFAGSITIGKKKFDSMQHAFDEVQNGQRIVVRGITDRWAVLTRDVDDITIDARGAVVGGNLVLVGDGHRIRGGIFQHARVVVFGDDAQISGTTFGISHVGAVSIEGDNALVRGCRVVVAAPHTAAVELTGDGARLLKNRIVCETRMPIRAFQIEGDDALVRGNRIEDASVSPLVVGDDARVERNRFTRGYGPRIDGDRGQLRRNRLAWTVGAGGIQGDDGLIEKNRGVSLMGDGFTVDGDRATVHRNAIVALAAHELLDGEAADVTLLHITGSDASVEKNSVHRRFVDAQNLQGTRRNATGVLAAAHLGLTVAEAFPPAGTAIWVEGDRAEIERNNVAGTALGIGVRGDAALTDDNRFDHVDVAVDVGGDGAIVCRNRTARAYLGVRVAGDDFTVDDNNTSVGRFDIQLGVDSRTVTRIDYDGRPGVTTFQIPVPGAVGDPIVVSECPAIVVEGADGTISGNRADHTMGGSGVDLDVTNTTISGNTVRGAKTGTTSLEVTGSGNTVVDNHIQEFGDEGLVVQGDSNTVSDNSLYAGNGDGVVVEGSNNALTHNTVKDVPGDGFCLMSGTENVITNCRAVDCGDDGLENRAIDTRVTRSTFSGTVWDVNNLGSFGVFEGNGFETFWQ